MSTKPNQPVNPDPNDPSPYPAPPPPTPAVAKKEPWYDRALDDIGEAIGEALDQR